MPDGDTASSNVLLERDLKGRDSYFFDDQVRLCHSEQCKVLGEELAKKEKQAHISYDKLLSDQFASRAQVDSALIQLMFESDVPVNPDALIDDLRLLAGSKSRGPELTRLLDFLLVSRRTALLLEEQEIRNGAPYDLYDQKNRSRFGPMATLANLLATDKSGLNVGAPSHSIALTLSLLATGQKELMSTVLVYLANTLGCPWDALILARYHFGQDDDVTRMIRAIWEDTVLGSGDDRFGSIKIAISLDSLDPKEVARALLQGVNNSKEPPSDPTNLFNAYRALSLALHECAHLPEEEREKQVSAISALMMSILHCFLDWAKLGWASALMGDMAKRAPPGGMNKEICKVVFRCHIELLDNVLASQGMEGKTPREGAFSQLALKWRYDSRRELTEMSKLKRADGGEQKEVLEAIDKLAAALGDSLREKEELDKKEECALLAASLLPQLLKWAIEGREGEELRMEWEGRQLGLNLAGASIFIVERAALVPTEHTEVLHEGTVADDSMTTEGGKMPNRKRNKQKKREEREERSDATTTPDVVSREESEGSQKLLQVHQQQSVKEQPKGKMQQLREKQQQREWSTEVAPSLNNNVLSQEDSSLSQGSQQMQQKEFHPAPHMGAMQQMRAKQHGQPVMMQRHEHEPIGQARGGGRGGEGDWRRGVQQSGESYAPRSSPQNEKGWRGQRQGEEGAGQGMQPLQQQQQYQARAYQQSSYGRAGGDRMSREYHGAMQQLMSPRPNQPHRAAVGEAFPPLQPLQQQPPLMKRHSHPFTARGGGENRGQNAQSTGEGQWARGQPPKAQEMPRPVTNHPGKGAEPLNTLDYSCREFTPSGLPLVGSSKGLLPVTQVPSWKPQSKDSARENRESSSGGHDSTPSGGREFKGEGRGRGRGGRGGARGGKKKGERN